MVVFRIVNLRRTDSMNKQGLVGLMVVAVTLSLLAGCAAPAAAPAAAVPAAAAPAAEAVSMQFLILDDPDTIAGVNATIEGWKKSQPEYAKVTVNLETVPFGDLFPKVETAVAAGANLDLFLADGPDIKHYAYNKAIISLAKYFTADDLKGFLPINVAAGSYKGEFYSPGIMESCSLMFYNQDMTDAAGVKPPQAVAGWTMAEAKAAWQKTVQKDAGGNVSVWGLRWGQGTYWGDYEHGLVRRSAGPKGSPTYQGMAPDGITFQGYMDTPEAIAAFTEQRSWYQGDGAVAPKEAIRDTYFNKQTAFMITPDNAIGTINRMHPDGSFKYGVTGIPAIAKGGQICHTDSWHFGISPQSKNQDVAAALVKYMTGPEGAKIWFDKVKQLPARIELLNTLPEYTKYPQNLFSQAVAEIGDPRIQTPGYTEYQQVFAELMQNLAQSDAPVETLVKDAVGKIEAALAKYKGWDK